MKWYHKKPNRVEAERIVLRKRYPRAWMFKRHGYLVISLKVRSRKNNYLLEIIYPDNFPYDEPEAYIVRPRIRNAPHRYLNGRLSLHGVDEVAPRISGKIIIDWALDWLIAYEAWLNTGKWPEKLTQGESCAF